MAAGARPKRGETDSEKGEDRHDEARGEENKNREDDRPESVRDGPMAGEEDEIGKEEAGGKERSAGGCPMRDAGSVEVEGGDVEE
jgi:hypothetical protein